VTLAVELRQRVSRRAIDTLEHMFENRMMAPPSSAASVALRVDDDLDAPESTLTGTTDVVRELQARIRGMQRTTLDTRALPTHPALGELLPGGALAAGGVYAVDNSTTLALGLLQGPSAAGSWCAIVGVPDLGVEAAAGLGLDLERLVLVPHPGEQWLAVVSALIDVVSVEDLQAENAVERELALIRVEPTVANSGTKPAQETSHSGPPQAVCRMRRIAATSRSNSSRSATSCFRPAGVSE